jgi:protein-L-isoaspartate(D-aspartate) O-methyltransferase
MKPMTEKHLAVLRRHMVEVVGIHVDLMSDDLGVSVLDPRVEEAMLHVPRHLFVPPALAALAYHDTPLPIGFDKTVSQPFIGALMIDLMAVDEGDSVLEVGTGLGYQAAILGEIVREVWSVEIVEEFAAAAELRLAQLGYVNVAVRVGDGSKGWAEQAPFDAILVTAAAKAPPPALVGQLKPGGRLVMPIGDEESQQISVIEKRDNGAVETRAIIGARFTQLETVS